jgi:hypothetical protein
MAVIQVGAIIYAARLAGRLERLANQVEREIQPMIGRLTTAAGEAARVSSLAVAQAERMDLVLTDLTAQVQDTVNQVRAAIVTPAREGRAVVSGIRAALAALRGFGLPGGGRRPEDEDALFIG